LTEISQKLQSRISQLPSGTDTTAMQASMSDLAAKVADAQSLAKAAVDEVSGLVPDNGDENLMKSNTEALQDARSKIIAAQKDLKAAVTDIQTIRKGLRAAIKPLSGTPKPATP